MEINVTDINDNKPEFLEEKYTLDIPENTAWTENMNISATDKDEGLNAELVYSLLNDYGMGRVKRKMPSSMRKI